MCTSIWSLLWLLFDIIHKKHGQVETLMKAVVNDVSFVMDSDHKKPNTWGHVCHTEILIINGVLLSLFDLDAITRFNIISARTCAIASFVVSSHDFVSILRSILTCNSCDGLKADFPRGGECPVKICHSWWTPYCIQAVPTPEECQRN